MVSTNLISLLVRGEVLHPREKSYAVDLTGPLKPQVYVLSIKEQGNRATEPYIWFYRYMYQLVRLRGNAPPEQSSLACGTMYYVRDLRGISKIDPKRHMLDRFMACVLMREKPAACPGTWLSMEKIRFLDCRISRYHDK